MEQNIISCPACNHQQATLQKQVKDYFLTQEEFQLVSCNACNLLFTHPRPSVLNIGDYYKSENYVSHSSTKKGIVNRIYGIVRSITLKQKVSLIKQLTNRRQLLDIGAGTGHFLSQAKKAGFIVAGLEPDSDARKYALDQHQLELKDLTELSKIIEKFDVVTMWHVLEHVYSLQEDLSTISTVVSKDGFLIIAVPNHSSYDAKYYDTFWAAYDVPRHLLHFTPETLIPLIEKYGFQFEKLLPMKFDAYYVSMLSEKYKGGNLLNALRIGFLSNLKAKSNRYSSQIYIFKKI